MESARGATLCLFCSSMRFVWNRICTHLPPLQTFMKNLMELFPTQSIVDTWSILWSFGGLWLPVYKLLQLFTDSEPLMAGHSLDHLQGFKVLTFSLDVVNHSESYVQYRAFLYTILSIMIVNVAVSQGSDQTWCLLAASCQQRNSWLKCGAAKDELMELELYIH